jgi:hypothetical protein
MMVNSAQPGEGVGALHALPLSLYLLSSKAERAETLLLFLLYPFLLCAPSFHNLTLLQSTVPTLHGFQYEKLPLSCIIPDTN